MHISNLLLLVLVGIGVAAFGTFVFWRESRNGNRNQAKAALVGIPGVYLYFCGTIEHSRILYIPGVALVLAGAIAQLIVVKRAGGRILPSQRRPRPERRDGDSTTDTRRYDEW